MSELSFLSLGTKTSCYQLDLAGSPKSWKVFPSLPIPLAYFGFVHVPYNNRLYVIGGYYYNNYNYYVNTVHVHDFKTNAWRSSRELKKWQILAVVLYRLLKMIRDDHAQSRRW